jgi:adenylate cyclase
LDERFNKAQSMVGKGIRSAMAVPLLVKGELRGLLCLDSQGANVFQEKDLSLFSAIAAQAAQAMHNAEEAAALQELSRFMSPAVANAVVKGEVESLRKGRTADVTVMFADIRGFTTMSEQERPEDVVGLLNAFFEAVSEVVFRHEGNLDKFIGDCVMAVWGPPSPHPDDAARALKAALEIQAEVTALNQKRVAAGKAPFQVGVGINTGPAVVGYMGSQKRHEFTAIGDSVNTASRLCGVAEGGQVIASGATIESGGAGFEVNELPARQVKGKEKPVPVFRVLGEKLKP